MGKQARKVMALFILGHAGTGKSWLTHRFVSRQHDRGASWCVLDKDVVSEVWTGPLLMAYGHDPQDRDSPFFKQVARDLGYHSTLRVGRDQIEHGTHVVFPGPWSRELASGAIFSPSELGLPECTRLYHVWLDLPLDIRKQRIIDRGDPRDQWKLAHWDEYAGALKRPAAVQDGRIKVLDASLPESDQLAFLDALLET
jgi:hypothetical protein